ncbi:Xylose import ATP-binding protein XylG [Neomoorella glycerini]|uniref:Xylose import ATP-binding protein XylG n=1 Tax=Neomoorella glycerini TaxID=55779 RepID=A0A6I5ZMX6_9FIRM|nr:ABC transporter ATP-binding protein [Moorella glycerini]QGP91230.1 Xylose import ATP-binding protein XylG [Moorella glycerini]
MAPILVMRDIVKEFGSFRANDGVNLEVETGEVHALLGENGAGKSTLMNILYGLYQANSGEIYFEGRPVKITSPKEAIDLGIGMVHQHFMLIPALTVAENIILGMQMPRGIIDLKEASRKIKELSRQYGFDIDPEAKVWQLSVGQQQRVEIVKALYRGARLLILDEPTAVLTPQEVNELFRVLKQLTQEGITVIFITHKLNEVMAICQRVTVLRAGKVVGTVATCNTGKNELARMMVGREVFFQVNKKPCSPGQTVLEVQGLEALSNKGLKALKGISFNICQGEILGIAGVDGNGQSELVEAITGLRPVTAGRVLLNGQDITNLPPRQILERNVAHIPEDRNVRGLVGAMSIKENLILQEYYKQPFSRGWFLNYDLIKDHAVKMVREFDIRTTSEELPVKNLSGGNQQKVVLAREVYRQPALLIAMHPTRGLDVGATEYVHKRLVAERDRGAAVLLVSTELDEILSLSDRIAVLYEGEIMGIVPGAQARVEELGLMMAGSKRLKAS